MPNPTADPKLYRRAAGAVIFNPQGQVWLGRRARCSEPYVWQFPQGGIDPGETAEHAAIRETEEETGISVLKLRPLGRIDGELFYDYPSDIDKNPRTRRWRGQRQSWFAIRFTGDASDINLHAQTPAEFLDWRWGRLSETPELIVPFKRKVYREIVSSFAQYVSEHADI